MEKNYRAELTGVFGDPVDANPTGVMEEAGFRAKGLNFRYITARVLPESLGAAVAGARAMHMKGFNLTMPHKVRVIPFLDGVTEAARIIGAVNTVYEENGNYIGENTDGKGFVEALKMQGESVEGKRVVLLGAGGAGKAIGVECALAGAATSPWSTETASAARIWSRPSAKTPPARPTIFPGRGAARFPSATCWSTPPA